MKRKIISYVLVLCMILAAFPASTTGVYAATSQADALVAHARKHIGDEYNNLYDRGPFKYRYSWCAEFVQHCSEAAGMSDVIPIAGCELAANLATNIVNSKGGKITFVNRSIYNSQKGKYASGRVIYNSSYAPKKGDLIFFYGTSSGRFSHVGIVSENCSSPTKDVKTIEGNVSGRSSSHRIVKEFTKRNSNSSETIAAYVTPDYQELKGVRYAGNDRYATAFAIADALKAEKGVTKFDNIVVAYGLNYPDALTGGYLAKVKNAPVLLVDSHKEAEVNSYISKNLKSGGAVYILGGTGVISENFETKVKELPETNVVRLGGTDRYETNLKILAEAGVTEEDILICTGEGYADSLSASAIGRPILLVGEVISGEQVAYIETLGTQKMYVIGGVGAVNETVYTELQPYCAELKRIGGIDRYETSKKLAEEFFAAPCEKVVLAYGGNYPDGLAGGPLAMAMGAPLLLASTHNTVYAKVAVDNLGIKSLYVLGGGALISNNAGNLIIK